MKLTEMISEHIKDAVDNLLKQSFVADVIQESIQDQLDIENDITEFIVGEVEDFDISSVITDAVSDKNADIESEIAAAFEEAVNTALADMDLDSIIAKAVEAKLEEM